MYRFFVIISLSINFCSWSMEEIPAIKIEEQENNTFEMVKKFLNGHKDKVLPRYLVEIKIEKPASEPSIISSIKK